MPGKLYRCFGYCVLFTTLCCLCGCGDGLGRVPMSGAVTFAGRPVEEGRIRFVPAPGTEMPLSVEVIRNGRYNTDIGGGVPPGTYRVEIRAFNPNEPERVGPGTAPRRQLLPAKYNTRSELSVTVEPGRAAIEHDFELAP